MSFSDDKQQEFNHELDLLLSEYGAHIEVRYSKGEDVRAMICCDGCDEDRHWNFDIDLGEGYMPPPSCATQGPGVDFMIGMIKALRWCATEAGASMDIIASAIDRLENGGDL